MQRAGLVSPGTTAPPAHPKIKRCTFRCQATSTSSRPVSTAPRYDILELNAGRIANLTQQSQQANVEQDTTGAAGGGPLQPAAPPPALQTEAFVSKTPVDIVVELLEKLFLPPGYPASTTPDYLAYQLWSMPTHVTGHLSHSLTTSSLLAAVGISAGPAGTAAASAAIRWIIKDGIGALGRLVIGTRLAAEFDEDPRRWRMVAELASTVGLGLEVATSIYPQHFLALACSGNFCIALGKGMGKPVFRVIQTHFAAMGNVGAVAAKEEVWEVTAQFAGLACSVSMLQALEAAGSHGSSVVAAWVAIQAVHVALRYKALQTLRFPSINQKRAAALVAASVAGAPLPSVVEANGGESMLLEAHAVRPYVHMGVPVAEAFGGRLPAGDVLQQYAKLYAGEGYLLVWRGRTAYAVLKSVRSRAGAGVGGTVAAGAGAGAGAGVVQGDVAATDDIGSDPATAEGAPVSSASNVPLLRAFWQAAWLDARAQAAEDAAAAGGGSSDGDGGSSGELRLLAESLAALRGAFPGFYAGLQAAGWDVTTMPVKVGPARLQVVERATAGAQ